MMARPIGPANVRSSAHLPGLLRVGGIIVLSGEALQVAARSAVEAAKYRDQRGHSTGHVRLLAEALIAAACGHSDMLSAPTCDPPSMPIHAAADALGVSPRHARRLAPDLGGAKVGGKWLVSPGAVAQHIEGRTR